MFAFLSDFFHSNGIDTFGAVPLSECTVRKPYLLEKAEIFTGTAVIFAVPYLSKEALQPNRNISAYAVPRDYHAYFSSLFGDLLRKLTEKFPNERFAAFSDHSPIDEIEAAAKAGLGVIGKNHLLLTEKYSSYVFLGELITSAKLPTEIFPVRSCESCGACERSCPAKKIGTCLSALTQKKGSLTEAEENDIRSYGSLWGCDLCQAVCPHTKKAIEKGTVFSPIGYFQKDLIPHLTVEILDGMDEESFSSRAFAWRGRETIRRNLILNERKK